MFKKTVILFLAAIVLSFCATSSRANEELHKRAKNLYDVGDYRAALNLYERILGQDPEDGTALDLSAWCLRYLGELKSSEEMFEKALTLLRGEDAVWVFIGLGEIYLDGKLYEKAVPRFQEALKAAPGDQEVTERASRGLELAQKALQETPEREAAPETTTLTDKEDRQKDALLGEQNAASAPNAVPNPEEPEPEPSPEPQPEPAPVQDTPSPDSSATTPQEAKPQKAAPQKEKTPSKPKKPSPKKVSEESAKAPLRYETVYGVTLGSNIDEALAKLKENGYPSAGEPFAKDGRTYHPVQGLPAALPRSLTDGAVSGHFYVTAYNEGVLSIVVQLNYDNNRSFEDLKNTLERELPELTGKSDTRGIRATESIFSYEVGLALSNTYGIWMYVTDKANGTFRVEIEHVDLTNLSHYWMAGGK
ncbi:MAG: tetratricopeptide repeat protein [Synergistaceae bacterium]|jgi:tetratricopeptide (TPR) repeat protein|nr:tetratricopeptide repeat protein [Synergistaceae bacterium]